MITLTGKQKSHLRGLAMTRPAVFRVGKEGITPAFLDAVDLYVVKNELVKIALLPASGVTADTLAEALAQKAIVLVQTIGNNVVMYRPNRRLEHPIVLPE